MEAFDENLTSLLNNWRTGQFEAEAKLFEAVQAELKKLCRSILKRNPSPLITFRTTEVFHELYMRLTTQAKDMAWNDRAHFFGIAAKQIRQFLIDTIRQKMAQKRQAFQWAEVFRDDVGNWSWPGNIDHLSDALDDLEKVDPGRALLIDLRFFMGFSMGEIAQHLSISRATATRRWHWTRAWLLDYLEHKSSIQPDCHT